jgi:hypothetical protein
MSVRRSSWRRVRAVGSAAAIAILITISLSLVYNNTSSDISGDHSEVLAALDLYSTPQTVVTEAEQATDHANQAAAVLGSQESRSNPSSMLSLNRLQSLSWRSADPFHRVLQPDKAANYGLAAAKAAQDQFEHTLVVCLALYAHFVTNTFHGI